MLIIPMVTCTPAINLRNMFLPRSCTSCLPPLARPLPQEMLRSPAGEGRGGEDRSSIDLSLLFETRRIRDDKIREDYLRYLFTF